MKLWSIHGQKGVPESLSSDVPNLMKDVPNFVKDVPRVRKCIPKWIGPKSLCYGFLNEIMVHPCSDGGPEITRLRCTKFNEGCTKFCEGRTKASKVRSEVGIDPKSLCYGFLNKIVAHPWSEGGPAITRLRCTKFNEGCTKFCEGYTKGSKVRFKVGIDPQSLSCGFLNEIMDHSYSDGGLGSARMGCTKFNEECTKFCE